MPSKLTDKAFSDNAEKISNKITEAVNELNGLASKETEANGRRDFLRFSALALVAGSFGATLRGPNARAQGAANKPSAGAGAGAGAGADLVKPTEPQAQALGYIEDAAKVDTKKWPKRAGKEGEKQYCWNCQFYQVKGDAKTSASGPCQIFAGRGVKAKGWCNSWVLNPKV